MKKFWHYTSIFTIFTMVTYFMSYQTFNIMFNNNINNQHVFKYPKKQLTRIPASAENNINNIENYFNEDSEKHDTYNESYKNKLIEEGRELSYELAKTCKNQYIEKIVERFIKTFNSKGITVNNVSIIDDFKLAGYSREANSSVSLKISITTPLKSKKVLFFRVAIRTFYGSLYDISKKSIYLFALSESPDTEYVNDTGETTSEYYYEYKLNDDGKWNMYAREDRELQTNSFMAYSNEDFNNIGVANPYIHVMPYLKVKCKNSEYIEPSIFDSIFY